MIKDIAVIIVCVGFADILRLTLPLNVPFFEPEKIIVVTAPYDLETQEVCRERGVTSLWFGGFHKEGAAFNKAGAVRLGQDYAAARWPGDFALLMDADIALPCNFEGILAARGPLDRKVLYGMPRLHYYTREHWETRTPLFHEHSMPMMGYFQLYGDLSKTYAEHSESAARCDFDFATQFDQRVPLSTCYFVSHLGALDVNHRGRVTARWEADMEP
jgi:hypothetical protein